MSDEMSGFCPAFPVTAGQQVYETGMTLRDWFAQGAEVLDESLSWPLARALMSSECPDYAKDPILAFTWWAEVEAKARYIKADAMLSARNIGGAA